MEDIIFLIGTKYVGDSVRIGWVYLSSMLLYHLQDIEQNVTIATGP